LQYSHDLTEKFVDSAAYNICIPARICEGLSLEEICGCSSPNGGR